MEEQKFLQNFIKDFRGRMNLALFLDWCFFAMGIGAAAALLAEVTALWIPFFYADLVAVLCVITGILCGMVIAYLKRYDMKAAALAIDRFGFEERVVTAYENLERKEWLLELQRKNAAAVLRQNKQMVKKKVLPSWKHVLPALCLCILTVVTALFPAETKEIARTQHLIARQAEEKKDEIRDALEVLEAIDTAGLTEEQIAQITAMKESLNASMSEMQEIASGRAMTPGEMMAAENAMQQANDRLDYKMDQIADQLGQMSQQAASQAGADVSQSSAESLQNAADRISGNNHAQANQNGQNGQNQSGNGVQANQNGQTGQSQSGNGVQANQNGQTGQSQSSNSAQANNGQNGTGQEGQNGQAGGGQTGAEGGEQAGQGSQAGQGGSEAGTGTVSNERDYVSVPNNIGNDEALHGNSSQSEDSEYYREQNGLAWEGERVTYEAVIGEYTNQAYEGLEQGRYPSGMTEVIKDYFGNLQ